MPEKKKSVAGILRFWFYAACLEAVRQVYRLPEQI